VTHPCSTCPRPATLTITGRIPGRTCYSALTCDQCAPKHRERAKKAGPVTEEAIDGPGQDTLW
jgi:protein-arginine kinase activator protein McsA